jgi:signal peptidase I
MTLDQPWKIAALIGLLLLLRIAWGVWAEAPSRKATLEVLDSLLIAFVLVFVIIRPFVVQSFFIPSESMEPTLQPSDRILVNKFLYRLNPPQRGDVIVFDAPPQALGAGDEHKDYEKRLVGLPGDQIRVRRNEGVYVNGKLLLDAQGVSPPDYDWPLKDDGGPAEPYRVPAGCYFVLGDNRNLSHDSHAWADPATGRAEPELAARRVLGKAMVVFWPPRRLRLVSDHQQVFVPRGTEYAGVGAPGR